MLFKYILKWLLPNCCVLCHSRHIQDRALCDFCLAHFVRVNHPCQICGEAMLVADVICGRCLTDPPAFDQAISAFAYEPPLSTLILRLKFHERLYLSKLLGILLAETCRLFPPPDYLIPVPLHPKRLRLRGFNQAREIAKMLSKILEIPLAASAVRRIRAAPPQASLSRKDRMKNLKQAFEIKQAFKATHVAIIDDVMTTGTTVNELAHALKKHGVKIVEVWVVARA